MPAASLTRKLLIYGIGTSAATVAGNADAEIVYSGEMALSGNTIFFDLQNTAAPSTTTADPAHDFRLSVKSAKSKAKVSGYGPDTPAAEAATRGMGARNYVLQLAPGVTVGTTGFMNPGGGYFNNIYAGGVPPGEGLGDWVPGERGFLGLSIIVGGSPLFGWADVSFNNYDGTGAGAFTLHGYAYEDTGAPIATAAVPEPSSVALLAAGAAGLLALRRRKKS